MTFSRERRFGTAAGAYKAPFLVFLVVAAFISATVANGDGFERTVTNKRSPSAKASNGMVWIPGGEFSMGAAMDGGGSCEMPMASNDAAGHPVLNQKL